MLIEFGTQIKIIIHKIILSGLVPNTYILILKKSQERANATACVDRDLRVARNY